MNPASRIWDIPPPPGTEDFDLHSSEPAKDRQPAEERPIDRINPYLKRSDYVEYEKRRKRSRSRSRHRRRYSRSRSRRSRSRSRRRRRRYSSSRSRSRSPRRRHKRAKRRKRSRSRSRSRTKGARKSRKSRTPSPPRDSPDRSARFEDEDDEASKDNVFKNDGTFLEMFKKMQEQREGKVEERSAGVEQKKALPAFGKRRGGKVLKTGLVQKVRLPNEEENNSQDVWSVYMKEVRKYKEACCDDDSKTRPLVK